MERKGPEALLWAAKDGRESEVEVFARLEFPNETGYWVGAAMPSVRASLGHIPDFELPRSASRGLRVGLARLGAALGIGREEARRAPGATPSGLEVAAERPAIQGIEDGASLALAGATGVASEVAWTPRSLSAVPAFHGTQR